MRATTALLFVLSSNKVELSNWLMLGLSLLNNSTGTKKRFERSDDNSLGRRTNPERMLSERVKSETLSFSENKMKNYQFILRSVYCADNTRKKKGTRMKQTNFGKINTSTTDFYYHTGHRPILSNPLDEFLALSVTLDVV